MLTKRKIGHFVVDFTSRFQLSLVGRAVRPSLPNPSTSINEIHGSSPTRVVGTIFLIISASCVSSFQVFSVTISITLNSPGSVGIGGSTISKLPGSVSQCRGSGQGNPKFIMILSQPLRADWHLSLDGSSGDDSPGIHLGANMEHKNGFKSAEHFVTTRG